MLPTITIFAHNRIAVVVRKIAEASYRGVFCFDFKEGLHFTYLGFLDVEFDQLDAPQADSFKH